MKKQKMEKKKLEKPALIEALERLLEAEGEEARQSLDDLVYEAATTDATTANNADVAAQVSFLLDHGFTADGVAEALDMDL